MTVTPFPLATPAQPIAPTPSSHVRAGDTAGERFFGEDGFTFEDFLDLINPLQHIPIVSTVYRATTGDEISMGARVLGGALFGGIVGLISAVINAIIEDSTGKDIGEHALALFDDLSGVPETAIAANTAQTATPAASPQFSLEQLVDERSQEQGRAVQIAASMIMMAPTDAIEDLRDAAPMRDVSPVTWAPKIHSNSSAMEARFGIQTAASDWMLLVLGQALDKYDNVLQARDIYERHPVAHDRPTDGVDTTV